MFNARLLSAVSLVWFALTACGGGDDAGDNDTDNDAQTDQEDPARPMTAAEVCGLYAVSVERVFERDICGLAAPEPDANAEARYCGPQGQGTRWAESLLASAEANRISIDWAKARQCNARARALRAANTPLALSRNSEWQALRAGDCATFYTPLVDTNGACVSVWDCKNPSDFCSTDAPYATASFTCKPRLPLGADCDGAFHPCDVGLQCAMATGKCATDVLPCATNEDCVGGSCLAGACIAPRSVAAGGACQGPTDCADECTVCTQRPAEATKTCKLIIGPDGACEIRSDCADDLGCTDGLCKALPAGSDCDHQNDACVSGTECLQPTDCLPLAEAACTAAAPYCAWSGTGCSFADGKCTAAPTSGPCLPTYSGPRCGSPAECLAGDETCRIPAALNEPCENPPVNAPRCGEDLQCVGGVCVSKCSESLPCASGQYCDSDTATCLPIVADICAQPDACGPGKYCPLAADVCALNADETTCAANPDCAWNGASCGEGVDAQRHCVALRMPGELAIGQCPTVPSSGVFGQNPTCDSGYCMNQMGAAPVCVVLPRGCINNFGDTTYDGSFIALPFIFGLVRWNRRRKR